MERELFHRGGNPVILDSGPGPLDGIFGVTPPILALWMSHACANHFEFRKRVFARRRARPVGRYGIVRLQLVVLIVPILHGIVMGKDTTVPGSIQSTRASVKALCRFIKQNVPRRQEHFVCRTLKVLNENGPRFRIITTINVEYEGDHVGLHWRSQRVEEKRARECDDEFKGNACVKMERFDGRQLQKRTLVDTVFY